MTNKQWRLLSWTSLVSASVWVGLVGVATWNWWGGELKTLAWLDGIFDFFISFPEPSGVFGMAFFGAKFLLSVLVAIWVFVHGPVSLWTACKYVLSSKALKREVRNGSVLGRPDVQSKRYN